MRIGTATKASPADHAHRVRMRQKVGNTKPLPDQDGTRRFELMIISIFLSDDLEAPLLVPLEPFFVRLPHMSRHASDAVLVHSLGSHALQEMCSDAM